MGEGAEGVMGGIVEGGAVGGAERVMGGGGGAVWFVGDSEDDVRCGRLAGCKTCLILTEYNRYLVGSELVDLAVESLSEFTSVILK